MNQILIGKFIAAERKAKGLTQRQLADELGISDKTVSKWETGKGFPEISLVLPLCDCLNITVNELLAGERLLDGEYKQKAEENMVNMIKEKDANKRQFRLTGIVGIMSSIAFLALIRVINIYSNDIPKGAEILLTIIAVCILVVGLYVATQGERTIGYYKCSDCNKLFIPSYGEYMKGGPLWSAKKLTCPHCNHKVQAKKVMSKEE